MTIPESRLLTPPREEEEIYPYRRVWPSVFLESGLLFAIAAGLYFMLGLLGIRLPAAVNRPLGIGLAFAPLGLWLAFSWWPEQRVPEPRARLIAVVIISALVANAIGIPLIRDFLVVDEWLPLSSAINRIIGYTFTVGIVQEMLKFLVVRFVIWPDFFRTRADAVAYCAASGVGYVTVLSLHFAFEGTPRPDIVAMQVFTYISVHTVAGILWGYSLGELSFGRPTPLLLPTMVALAAFLTGLAVPVRAGLVNAGLSTEASMTKPLFGLIFAAAFLFVWLLILLFLFTSAEHQPSAATYRER